MVKRFQRALTGQTAIERICSSERFEVEGVGCMPVILWKEWSTSHQLSRTFAQYGTNANMNVIDAAAAILAVKEHGERSTFDRRAHDVRENLIRCLIAIRDVNALKVAVESLRQQHFSAENEDHERLLEKLWARLMPDKPRQGGRISGDWGDIGFQQRDPSTDFRGGGMLGLEQLVYMASTRTSTAQRMLREPARAESRYPWACVGINVTMETLNALRSSRAQPALLAAAHAAAFARGTDAAALACARPDVRRMLLVYHNIYADMFEAFHSRWVAANPENVLAFKPIFEKAMRIAERELERDGAVRTQISGGEQTSRRQKSE